MFEIYIKIIWQLVRSGEWERDAQNKFVCELIIAVPWWVHVFFFAKTTLFLYHFDIFYNKNIF